MSRPIFRFSDLAVTPVVEIQCNLRWRYNRFGHIELWNLNKHDKPSREADLYMQGQDDVRMFFQTLGLNPDEAEIGDEGTAVDPGYF